MLDQGLERPIGLVRRAVLEEKLAPGAQSLQVVRAFRHGPIERVMRLRKLLPCQSRPALDQQPLDAPRSILQQLFSEPFRLGESAATHQDVSQAAPIPPKAGHLADHLAAPTLGLGQVSHLRGDHRQVGVRLVAGKGSAHAGEVPLLGFAQQAEVRLPGLLQPAQRLEHDSLAKSQLGVPWEKAQAPPAGLQRLHGTAEPQLGAAE